MFSSEPCSKWGKKGTRKRNADAWLTIGRSTTRAIGKNFQCIMKMMCVLQSELAECDSQN
jgi:hypothetical protein